MYYNNVFHKLDAVLRLNDLSIYSLLLSNTLLVKWPLVSITLG